MRIPTKFIEINFQRKKIGNKNRTIWTCFSSATVILSIRSLKDQMLYRFISSAGDSSTIICPEIFLVKLRATFRVYNGRIFESFLDKGFSKKDFL